MNLKSVDKPKVKPSQFEGLESDGGQQRKVTAASAGQAPAAKSRAAERFLVRGTSAEPLSEPKSLFESILGDVDRRQQILETEASPWRMICSLDILSQSGFPYVGTGWFVGPRTIITAGHCVYDPVELGGWAAQITVIPGLDGDEPEPFGRAVSTNFSTTDRWLEARDPDFDYAAIHLDEDLGATVGHFGVGVLTDADLNNRLVNVSGYPVWPGEGQLQYFHANRIKALTARRLFYDVDTYGGQSGSPVWAYLDGSDEPVVIGIHAYGVGGVPAGLGVVANSGPRILPEVLEVIRGWIERGGRAE